MGSSPRHGLAAQEHRFQVDAHDAVGIEQRHVLANHAGLFQPFHAAQAGGWRQADLLGHILIRQAPILLQDGQDFTVKYSPEHPA